MHQDGGCGLQPAEGRLDPVAGSRGLGTGRLTKPPAFVR